MLNRKNLPLTPRPLIANGKREDRKKALKQKMTKIEQKNSTQRSGDRIKAT